MEKGRSQVRRKNTGIPHSRGALYPALCLHAPSGNTALVLNVRAVILKHCPIPPSLI